jgi:hypothetical protein
MKDLKNFLIYNNTVPIILGVLFLGTTVTFAASPDAREAVVKSETSLASVDNSYLLQAAINDTTVEVNVVSVTENDIYYYVEYTLTTIEPQDGVWQPVTKTKTLEVRKDTIVGQDLGLYASEELGEVHAFEVRRLKEFQETQRNLGQTDKVVATEYSGLVGQFLDPVREVFPQYDPLISPDGGVPLTKEQEAAHREARKQLEESRKKQTFTTESGTTVNIPNIGGEEETDPDDNDSNEPAEEETTDPETDVVPEEPVEEEPTELSEPVVETESETMTETETLEPTPPVEQSTETSDDDAESV